MGAVSGNGWAIGTAGGVICLLLILPLIVMIEGTFIVRLTLVITAVFFALSSLPIFLWLPEKAPKQTLPPGENYLSLAFKRLSKTIRTARQFREFIKFMVAFLIYNDGVIMALDFAAIIGAVLFGMEQQGLIIFVIIVQLTNVVGAFVFGKWVDKLGGKKSLIISILIMIGVVLALYFNQTQTGFFVIGAIAGFAMAGTQSVSRTMVGMFAPPGKGAEFYGFFAMAGRTSSFIGPTIYGIIAAEAALWYLENGQSETLAEQSGQRLAILSIAVFFVVGLGLLMLVNESKARASAAEAVAAD
jgi:UMF1 family MFS transporter